MLRLVWWGARWHKQDMLLVLHYFGEIAEHYWNTQVYSIRYPLYHLSMSSSSKSTCWRFGEVKIPITRHLPPTSGCEGNAVPTRWLRSILSCQFCNWFGWYAWYCCLQKNVEPCLLLLSIQITIYQSFLLTVWALSECFFSHKWYWQPDYSEPGFSIYRWISTSFFVADLTPSFIEDLLRSKYLAPLFGMWGPK